MPAYSREEDSGIREIEELLLKPLMNEDPDQIIGYNPGEYIVQNTGTGAKYKFFSLSPDRAIALAYLNYGWESPFEVIGSPNEG